MLKSTSSTLFQLRKRYLLTLAWGMILVSGVGAVPVIIAGIQGETGTPFAFIILLASILLNSVWLTLLQRETLFNAAAVGLLFTLLFAYFFSPSPSFLIAGTLTVITAAVMAGRRLYLAVNAFVIIRLLIDVSGVVRASGGFPNEVYDYTLPLIVFAVTSLSVRYFVQSSQTTIEESSRTAMSLKAASDIGLTITQQDNPDEIMRRTINFIRDRFGFYHAQVFILNETGDQAVLRASTGDIGYQLLARRHQITVGSQSVVGQAVLRAAPVLVADTADEVVYFRNELLPNTRAEFTVPLKDAGKVFGAMDVQSTVADSFTEIDQQALEVIAELLALALRDARLSAEGTRNRHVNERLQAEMDALQRDNQRLNRELTQTTWSEFMTMHREIQGVDLHGDQVVAAADWTPDLRRAGSAGEVVNEGRMVAVPVMLRGEVIGAIEVEPGRATAAETAEIAQAVAQRLAVSLESARLYDETRQSAQQEQQINEIAARFSTTASIDELLQIALVELGESLGAQSGAIRLGRMNNGAAET